MITTTVDASISEELVCNYFKTLVNRFFKILPMREENEPSLPIYMKSLRSELIGCSDIIVMMDYDPRILTLISTLQYLIQNPDCPVKDVRREVFKSIGICEELHKRYMEMIGQ